MSKQLLEYKEILWEYRSRGYDIWVVPFCPVHKMELAYRDQSSSFGICEKCEKTYTWRTSTSIVADFIRRVLNSADYKTAEITTIDGIQTPQVKTRVKLKEENKDYWIEARINESDKGRQIVLYAGEKGSSDKAQLFINADQEKLSFDHKDRKPEDIFTEIVATFPSGKKMKINAPNKK